MVGVFARGFGQCPPPFACMGAEALGWRHLKTLKKKWGKRKIIGSGSPERRGVGQYAQRRDKSFCRVKAEAELRPKILEILGITSIAPKLQRNDQRSHKLKRD